MKIAVVHREPKRLELRLVPKAALWMVLFGLLFLVSGLVTIWLLGGVTHVRIDGEHLIADQLLLNRFSTHQRRVALSQINEINTKIYDYGISRSYEINVVTDSEEFPIPVASLDGDQKAVLAKQMNLVIRAGEEFEYRSGVGMMWCGILVSVLCFACGYVCLALLQTSTISADRSSYEIVVNVKRWLMPWRQRTESVKISEISGIDDEDFTVGRGSTGLTASSKYVFLETKPGQTIQLADGPMFTEESAAEVSRLLMHWLEG